MSGYLKISALVLFMLIASAAAMGVMKEEMEEGIIKELKAMKEAEKALDVKSGLLGLMELIKREECTPSGHICPLNPQFCCSGSCVAAHVPPIVFVCA